MKDPKKFIAYNIAQTMKDGEVVNLGIGIPTMVLDYLPEDVNVTIQAETGVVGCRSIDESEADPYLRDAGSGLVGLIDGGSTVDSAQSFGLIRGGHVDTTVLGALEVSEGGDIASWDIPGKALKGVGGAMDLVVGAKKVIVAMTHTDRQGNPKIKERCTMPLTAVGEVDYIFTDLAAIEVVNGALVLRGIAYDSSVDEVTARTGAKLEIPGDPVVMYGPSDEEA